MAEGTKHIFKQDEILWLCSMGKKFRVTAIFTTDQAANEHMRKHDDQACIASFGPFVILANKYAGEPVHA